jgi:hypothetical protein
MTWYALLRVVHSYWRWAVIVAGLIVVIRAVAGVIKRKDWAHADNRAVRLFMTALDIQFTIGIVLYFGFSPFFSAVYHTFSESMRDQGTRFFGIEHQVAMLIASVVAHAGSERAKRAVSGTARHRTMLIVMVVFFAIVLWAIPWPSRAYGRPLLRTTW